MLHKFHHFTFITLIKPFHHVRYINKYKKRLKMPLANSNCNGKIWIFTNQDIGTTVVKDTEQKLTLSMKHQIHPRAFMYNCLC